MRSAETQTQQTTVTTIGQQFKESDDTIPYRFVGSYEYANALDSFTRLLRISSEADIEVYDSFLASRPEFTFFNGANTAFSKKPNLQAANPFARQQFYDTFQQKGLAWMMALARIELGATMSLYGDAEKPFESIAGSANAFGLQPYLNVLADDVVAHMKSLSEEIDFENVVKRNRKIDTWTMAYLRRLKLIRDMLSTISRAGDDIVKARVLPYDRELKRYERRLIEQIEIQTRPKTGINVENVAGIEHMKSRILKVSGKMISNCADIVRQNSPSGGSGSSEGTANVKTSE